MPEIQEIGALEQLLANMSTMTKIHYSQPNQRTKMAQPKPSRLTLSTQLPLLNAKQATIHGFV